MTLREDLNIQLGYMRDLTVRISFIKEEIEQQLAKIRENYQEEITNLQGKLDCAEKQLIACLKRNKSELFNKTEKVTLPHGIVIYTKEPQLKLPKNAVENIEKLGWSEAIKIAKSVDREMVEKWPIERIIAIGGDKKPKEKFEYELIEVKG